MTQTHLQHFIEALEKFFCRSDPVFDWWKQSRKRSATGRRGYPLLLLLLVIFLAQAPSAPQILCKLIDNDY